MTIEELSELKACYEAKIAELLNDFETKAGVSISCITLKRYDMQDVIGYQAGDTMRDTRPAYHVNIGIML